MARYHRREPWTNKSHPILMPVVLILSFGALAFFSGTMANLSYYYDNETIAAAAVTMFAIAALVSMWGLFEASVALGEMLELRRRQREYGKRRSGYYK